MLRSWCHHLYCLVPEHFHHKRKQPCNPWALTPYCPCHCICFLSLWIWLLRWHFIILYKLRIIQSVAFCDWLLSVSIFQSVTCHMLERHPFLWPHNKYSDVWICSPIYQLVGIWVFAAFWHLWVKLPWIFVYRFLCEVCFLFILIHLYEWLLVRQTYI